MSGRIIISCENNYDETKHDMCINHSETFEQLSVGDILKIDFDGVTAKIENISQKSYTLNASVMSAGAITKNRAIDIDQKLIHLNALTKFDQKILGDYNPKAYQDIYISFCNKETFLKSKNRQEYKLNHEEEKINRKIETIKGVQNLNLSWKKLMRFLSTVEIYQEIKISRIPILHHQSSRLVLRL